MVALIGALVGCARPGSPPAESVDAGYRRFLQGASVRELLEEIRTKELSEKTFLRPDVAELVHRGLHVFPEVADAFLDEDPRLQSASRYIITSISRLHYGYDASKMPAWPSRDAEEKWSRVWLSPEMDGFGASTPEQRQAVVKRWKRWYAENVTPKRKV